MWEWVISVCLVVLISSLIMVLIPEGRLTGIVGVILAVAIISVIIKPIKNVDFISDFEFFSSNNVIEVDYSYAEHSNYLKCEEIKQDCIKALEEINIINSKIDVIYEENEYRQFNIKLVKVFLSKEVINLSEEHIDIIDKVKTTLSKLLFIDEGAIEVYVE